MERAPSSGLTVANHSPGVPCRCLHRLLFFRNSRNDCRINTAASWSTTPARCRLLRSVSRNSRLASTEVKRSSNRWTGSLNLRRNSSANTRTFSDWMPSLPLMRSGNPITNSAMWNCLITRRKWSRSLRLLLRRRLHAQRGRADFDIRQNFLADGTWDVPNNYSNLMVRNILGGWQFGGKWVGETGLPFTVINGSGFAPICSGGAALVNNQCPAGTTIVGNSGGDYNAGGYNTKLT